MNNGTFKKVRFLFTFILFGVLPISVFGAQGQDISISQSSGGSLASSTVSVTRNDTTRLYLSYTPPLKNPYTGNAVASVVCGFVPYFGEYAGQPANIVSMSLMSIYGVGLYSSTCPLPDEPADWYLWTTDLADDGRLLSTTTKFTTLGPTVRTYDIPVASFGGGGGGSIVEVDFTGIYIGIAFLLFFLTSGFFIFYFKRQ